MMAVEHIYKRSAMLKNRKFWILNLMVLALKVNIAIAQSPKSDSLRLQFEHCTTDSCKAFVLQQLAWQERNSNPDQALKDARSSIGICEKKDFKTYMGNCYNTMGELYFRQSNFDSALFYFKRAIAAYDLLGVSRKNQSSKAAIFNNMAGVFYTMGNYAMSVNYLQKAADIHRNLGNKQYLAEVLTNMGVINYEMGKPLKRKDLFENAILQTEKAIQIYRELNIQEPLATNYGNLGSIYHDLEQYEKSRMFLDSAFKIGKATGNKLSVSTALQEMGGLLCDEAEKTKNTSLYNRALIYLKSAIQMCDTVQDFSTKSNALCIEGRCYENLGQLEKAEQSYRLALDLSTNLGLKETEKNTSFYLSGLYKKLNKPNEAYVFLQRYTTIKDTLMSSENRNIFTEMQTKFETREKEIENKYLKDQSLLKDNTIQKEKTIKKYLIVLVAMAVFMIFLMYRAYINKRKSNKILMHQKHQIEEQKKEITDSINYASRIQSGMLPNYNKLNTFFADSFVLYKPKDIVSGDFYWFGEQNNKYILACADCTGHGVPGAMMSMLGNEKLNNILKQTQEPDKVLKLLNKEIRSTFSGSAGNKIADGMDIAFCSFDSTKRLVHFAGANRPLLLIRNTELKEFSPQKAPIGGNADSEQLYSSHTIDVQKGDVIYVFTDGYADQFGGEKEGGKKFMTRRFKELLLEIQSLTMSKQRDMLEARFNEWKRGYEQVDDVLVIGVRIG